MTYKERISKNTCLYETDKVAMSAHSISSDTQWRRIPPLTTSCINGTLRYITPSRSTPNINTQ